MDNNNMYGGENPQNNEVNSAQPVMPEQPVMPAQPVMPEQTVAPQATFVTEDSVVLEEPESLYQAPPMSPVQNQKPKKKGKGCLIFAIIAVVTFLLVIVGAVVVVASVFLQSPEKKILKGISNLNREFSEIYSPFYGDLGIDKFIEKRTKEGCTDEFTMNFTVEDVTCGVDYTQNYDPKNKKLDLDFDFSMMNIPFVSTKFIADEKNIYLSFPGLADDNIWIPTDDFAEKYNQSVLATYLGTQVPEDFELNIFDYLETSTNSDLSVYFADDVDALIQSLTVVKTGEKETFKIGEKEVDCNKYVVHLTKDEVNQLLEDVVELYSAGIGYEKYYELTVDEDMDVNIYLDKNNRIVSIHNEAVTFILRDVEYDYEEEVRIEADFDLLGETNTIDCISGNITFSDEYDKIIFFLDRYISADEELVRDNWFLEAYDSYTNESIYYELYNCLDLNSLKGDITLDMEYEEEIVSAAIFFEITDYEKGSSYTVTIDEASISAYGEVIGSISGELESSILKEKIEIPEDKWAILDATEEELQNYIMQFYTNLSSKIPY